MRVEREAACGRLWDTYNCPIVLVGLPVDAHVQQKQNHSKEGENSTNNIHS